jgi:cell division septal protein FtsQ
MLLTHPFIKGAEVKRRLPDRVEIVIEEREPVAFVLVGVLFVMDSSGDIFKAYSKDDALDLPVLTGMAELETDGYGELRPGLKPEFRTELLGLIRVLTDGSWFGLESISELHADPVFGFSMVTLDHGVRVEMGRGGVSRKLENLQKVIGARGGSLAGVTAVDLTSARGVIVKFAEGGPKRSA